MVQHRFYGLRGQSYVKAYKEFLAQHGEGIAFCFNAIVEAKGKFTPQDLGFLCNEFLVPVKLMDDCLPSLSCLQYPTGTWERLQARGMKARDIGVVWRDRDPIRSRSKLGRI